MRKRFAIVIGVAAAGVMALGAQTAAAAVIPYDTKVTIHGEVGDSPHNHLLGKVKSEVSKCEHPRRVVLFKRRPGADRKVGTVRTRFRRGDWSVLKSSLTLHHGFHRLYAMVKKKVRDRFVCRTDRSETIRTFVR